MGRLSSQNEVGRSAFKILTGKTAGKRSIGRLRRRWEDTIKMEKDGYRYVELDLFGSGQRLSECPCGCAFSSGFCKSYSELVRCK